jgi:hypothetical protein
VEGCSRAQIACLAGSAYSGMSKNSLRSYDFLWLGIALLFILPIAFILSIPPHDYWWYVRIGQDIAHTGVIPTTDTFSYTYFGRPVFYQPWLAALIFWFAHNIGGATLTFLLRGLAIGIAYSLLWGLMRSAGTETRLATLLLILMGLSSSMNWSMRPQIFAYPLFAVAFWAVWNWQNGRTKYLWLLPVASLLWANLHGSFVLIFVLIGSALIFGAGDRKTLSIWLGMSFIATLLNPRGFYVWQFVPDMLNSPSDQLYATEWRPPVNTGWQMNIFFAWFLLFIPLAVFSRHRLSRMEWVWFIGFGWLALSGLRYVIWFMFILALYSGPLLTDLLRQFLKEPVIGKIKPSFNYILGGLFILLPLMLLPGIREQWWKDAPSPYHLATTPIEAAEWLGDHPNLPGPLFAEFTFSSYLTFALPSRLVWIDNRFNAYPPKHWEKYQEISSARPQWEVLLDEDGVNLLMLSLHTQPALVQAVAVSDQWCEQYRDDDAVIFSRCEALQ